MTPRTPTTVRVHPGDLSGRVRVPGDKSISHRALILGCLAGRNGHPVDVRGVNPGDDVVATAQALAGMGGSVTLDRREDGLAGQVSGPLSEPEQVVDLGNSGTGLRLLTGVAAGTDGLTVLTGDDSLRARPMQRVTTPLRAMGASIDGRDNARLAPLAVRGGGLRGVDHDSPVASAQVKSCVLLAGLRAEGDTTVTSPARSRDHTERMLDHLGRPVELSVDDTGTERVRLAPGSPPRRSGSSPEPTGTGSPASPLAPRPLRVPADLSSAAFWMVAACVGGPRTDGTPEVRLPDVGVNPTRLGAVTVLRQMGAAIELSDRRQWSGEPVADVRVRAEKLAGTELAGQTVIDAIDELPVLAVAGALSDGGLEVADAAELRVKESDRIAGIATSLTALGMVVDTRPDGFAVPGGQRPSGGRVDADGDHRLAMTACVAATVAVAPVEVVGFDCVATSYPGFVDDFRQLGGDIEILDTTDTPVRPGP